MDTNTPAPAPAPARKRRWPRRVAIGVAIVLALLAVGAWWLGRPSTLQTLAQKAVASTGGKLKLSGVRGSLYGPMHVDHLVYRTAAQLVTIDNVDLRWSPSRLATGTFAIDSLHAARVRSETLRQTPPQPMPASLAPPVAVSVRDARVDQLLLASKGATTEIDNIRLGLDGDKQGWRLRDAHAATPWGQLAASGTIGAARPHPLDLKATLTQDLAQSTRPARLSLHAGGDLATTVIDATGMAGRASGTAHLELAPYAKVPLHAFALHGRNLNPGFFGPGLPTADLTVAISARLGPKRSVSGSVDIANDGPVGTIDQERLPLRALRARLGGDLSAMSITDVLVDLGAAGQFTGKGMVHHQPGSTTLGQADFVLRTDRLDLHQVYSTMRPTAIAGQLEVANAGDTQSVRAHFSERNMDLALRARLSGNDVTLDQARLQAGHGSVAVHGSASLAGDKPFDVQASVNHFDPAALGDLPAADLNAVVKASGKLAPAWGAALDFTVKPSRLLGQSLSGSGKLHADAAHLSGVDAQLAFGHNQIALRGSFGEPGESLRWRVDGAQLDALRAGLYGKVSANGELTGTMAEPRSTFVVDAEGLGMAAGSRRAANGSLHASGEARLAGAAGQRAVAFKASGTASHFNPAAFGSALMGSIDASFDASGHAGKNWGGSLRLALQPQSTLSGAPLGGHARLDANHAHVSKADVQLRVGPNQLAAEGAFGRPGDSLDWRIDAPRLAVLGPGYAGQLRGQGRLSGTMDAPALSASLDGQGLAFLGRYAAATLHADASLGAGHGANDPLAANVEASDIVAGKTRIAALRLHTTGTRGAHTISLDARGDGFDAALAVRGGWSNDGWSGTVGTLRNRGSYAFQLQQPVALRIGVAPGAGLAGLAHPRQIVLDNALVALPEGSLHIDSLHKDGPRWSSRGGATGVPLHYLTQFSPSVAQTLSGDLTLGAQWALDMRAAATPGAIPALDGSLRLFRESGDVRAGAEVPVALGLRQFDARAEVSGGELHAQLEVDGERAGHTHAEAAVQLLHGLVQQDSPLRLAVNADMPSIAWLAPLTAQPGMSLDGTMHLALSGTGTVGAPTLTGNMTGDRLAVRWTEQGVNLQGGVLRAALSGEELRLQQLSFKGPSGGTASVQGAIRFAGASALVDLKLVADKLEALSRPDRTVVVSGSATLVRNADRFALEGSFRADRALIELAPQGGPTISNDVVVLGRNKPQEAAPQQSAQPLTIDLRADLGDQFHVRGKGVDATLAGQLHVRRVDHLPPRVNGTIRVVNGVYAAYGQKLAIERGVVTFSGAYDNPSLDILAVRKLPGATQPSETNVEAGVEVRGSLQSPVAKLVSNPTVPDSEKLSWLVLGHGTQGTSASEADVLGAAASALLSGSGGGGFQNKIAGALGLDEIGVSGAANGLESTVVTVGKRLSSRAYLSFEQGTGTATSVVRLRYKINPRITLQLQTGTNTALDVLYSWSFD